MEQRKTPSRLGVKIFGSCFPYAKKKMEMGTPYEPMNRRGRGRDELEVSDRAEVPRGTPILSAITRTPSISMMTQIDLFEKRASAKFERKRSMSTSIVNDICDLGLSRTISMPKLEKRSGMEKKQPAVPPNTPISPINSPAPCSYHSVIGENNGRGYPRGYSTPRAGSTIHLVKKLDESSICLAPGEHPNFEVTETSPDAFESITLDLSTAIDRAALRVLQEEEETPTFKRYVHFRPRF